MFLGLFEPTETRLVSELLGPGDTFVDVGAHIGWFTTIGSRCVGAGGVVVAFEPFMGNARLLAANLERNSCRNVRVVLSALGSERGTLTLATDGDSGAVTALDWGSGRRTEVPVTTLDEAQLGLSDIHLIKMDVEGWESHVLRGATETLQRARSALVEINEPAMKKAGSTKQDIVDLLRDAGFTYFFRVNEGALRRVASSQVYNVLAIKSPAAPTEADWRSLGVRPRTIRRCKPM